MSSTLVVMHQRAGANMMAIVMPCMASECGAARNTMGVLGRCR